MSEIEVKIEKNNKLYECNLISKKLKIDIKSKGSSKEEAFKNAKDELLKITLLMIESLNELHI